MTEILLTVAIDEKTRHTKRSIPTNLHLPMTLTFYPWPLKSIQFIHFSLATFVLSYIKMQSMVWYLVLIRLYSLLPIVTLTFYLWPPKSIGFILSSCETFVPSLIKIYWTVWSVLRSQAYFHFCLLWPWSLTIQNEKGSSYHHGQHLC